MMFQDKAVLVTGGTGSMGSAFIRRLLDKSHGTPKRIRIFSRDEAKQFWMRDELQKSDIDVQFRLGDIRRASDVAAALNGIDVVINAAALKQVPTCEYEPEQALLTNCIGPINIIKAIRELRLPVQTVIGISTDKACKPVNVMGITKALQERIFIAANLESTTRYVCVRYGNVLASRGSVIPTFIDRISQGREIVITDPGMTRFLLTINEAVDVVLAAIKDGRPGETFIPIAPSATVLDLALAVIGKRKVEIRNIGPRPGEKKHEILVSEEERYRCVRNGFYYRIQPSLEGLTSEKVTDQSLLKEYSSSDHVISSADVSELLTKNCLTADSYQPRNSKL
jgi:FlaA1/EpsC-like NDP-sugar epimerase